MRFQRMKKRLDNLDYEESGRLMEMLSEHLLSAAEAYSQECGACSSGNGAAVGSWCCMAKRIADMELPAVSRKDFDATLEHLGLPRRWRADFENTYRLYHDEVTDIHFGRELQAETDKILALGKEIDDALQRITDGDDSPESRAAYRAARSRLAADGKRNEKLFAKMQDAGLGEINVGR